MNVYAMNEFLQALRLVAAMQGMRESAAAIAEIKAEIASLQAWEAKAKRKGNAEDMQDARAALQIEAAKLDEQTEAHRYFTVAFNAIHEHLFKPVQVSRAGNKAQITVVRGGKSYTRHVQLQGGKWHGNAIVPGMGITTYAIT